jgi:hypothetical protein
MFHGFDFDNTMLRIGSMNMLLHGVESPDIRYRDSLAQEREEMLADHGVQVGWGEVLEARPAVVLVGPALRVLALAEDSAAASAASAGWPCSPPACAGRRGGG